MQCQWEKNTVSYDIALPYLVYRVVFSSCVMSVLRCLDAVYGHVMVHRTAVSEFRGAKN